MCVVPSSVVKKIRNFSFQQNFYGFNKLDLIFVMSDYVDRNVSNANAVEVLKFKLSFRSSDSSHLV